ncbi:hypothetical protein [Paenibacillus sp. GP183]|uniref:hypothetical protein n=1 Tax=Paenibacillus sp. GP183 TaxID=1882751 RepID=UPI000895F114|nr:hypothetical protein [Paenibacillus sp. GP183]SEB93306.1 hypothetical protein SAMN05443246_2394 [Paenibacillus sp. GP183]
MQGFILALVSSFIGSFLILRLFSPWAKTYWKKDLIIAIVQATVFTIILVTLSHSTNTNNFSEIISALGRNTTELNREPGIIRSGTASDQNQKLIKVGIGIDRTKITDYRLKQVVESYLSNSAALTNERDWKKLLLPYTLKIEEIGDSNNGRILAEKQSGGIELTWKE